MLRILASRANAHAFSRPSRSSFCAARAVSGQQPTEKPKRSESAPRRSVSTPRAPRAEAKPKALRAPSAYNLYVKSKFGEVKAELTAKSPATTIRLPEVSKELRIRWDALPGDARSPYEQEAAKLKASVNAANEQAKAQKKANARPLTAYMLFANKERPAQRQKNPTLKMTELTAELGKAWRGLSDEAKKLLDAWKAKQEPSA